MTAPDPAPSTRLAFELTTDEAGIAASRAALRRALAGGLTSRHLAPLAAFVIPARAKATNSEAASALGNARVGRTAGAPERGQK